MPSEREQQELRNRRVLRVARRAEILSLSDRMSTLGLEREDSRRVKEQVFAEKESFRVDLILLASTYL